MPKTKDGGFKVIDGNDPLIVDYFKQPKQKRVSRALNPCGMTAGGTFDKGNSCAGTKGTGKNKPKKTAALEQDGRLSVDKAQTKTKEFKRWFQNSEIVTNNGDPQLAEPIVLYHGTTHEFEEFTLDRANFGNDLGRGFYFSDSLEDVETYYGEEGPDLMARINNEIDEILYNEKYGDDIGNLMAEIDDILANKGVQFNEDNTINYGESTIDADEIMQTIAENVEIMWGVENKPTIEAAIASRLMNASRDDMATAMAVATVRGSTERILQVYLKMNKPFYMAHETSSAEVKSDQTQLFAEAVYMDEEGRLQEDAGFDMDTATITEMIGPAWDIIKKVEELAQPYERLSRIKDELDFITTDIIDNEGISASSLITQLKEMETLQYATNDDGKMVGADIITEALRSAGYDGIVYLEPSRHWNMVNLPKDARHYIVFDSKQIKSATHNSGKFDPDDPNINRTWAVVNAIERFTSNPAAKKKKGKVGGCGNSGQGFVEGNTCAKGTKAGPVAGAKEQSKTNRPEGSHENTTMFMDQEWAKDYVGKKDLKNIEDFEKAIQEDIYKLTNMNDVFVVPLDKDGKVSGTIVQVDRRMRKPDGTPFDILGLTSGEYRLEVIPIENSPTRKKGVETNKKGVPVRKDNLEMGAEFKKKTANMSAKQTHSYANTFFHLLTKEEQTDVAQYIAYKAQKQDYDSKQQEVAKAIKKQAAYNKKVKSMKATINAHIKKQATRYSNVKTGEPTPDEKAKAAIKKNNTRLARFRREIRKFNYRTSPKEIESKMQEFLSWQETMTEEQIGMNTNRTAKKQKQILEEVKNKLDDQMTLYDLIVGSWKMATDAATRKSPKPSNLRKTKPND